MKIGAMKTGILLTNLGTPDAPTAPALRRYLAEFLFDRRVVEIPRPIWWLILHGIILRTRPKKSAKLYQQIWTEHGSPLLALTQQLAEQLQQQLPEENIVVVGMRYGKPAIRDALLQLRRAQVQRLVVLPLYPQYASATTASTFDQVTQCFRHCRAVPELHMIMDYHAHPDYIAVIAHSIQTHWQSYPKGEKLLFSFHGLPQRVCDLGDPYAKQCHTTAKLVAEKLALQDAEWQVVFQSRFGPAKWLQPYCDLTLEKLAQQGVKSVDVICPGFAVDCLETLQEMALENKQVFIEAGGKTYHYIPALNASPEHAKLLVKLLTAKKIL
jgi:ferrochelatase